MSGFRENLVVYHSTAWFHQQHQAHCLHYHYSQTEYGGDSGVKANDLITLKREFELVRMKETETVQQYSTKLNDLANKIRLQGANFPDTRVVEKMMGHEQRAVIRMEETSEDAFQARQRRRQPVYSKSNNGSHSKKDNNIIKGSYNRLSKKSGQISPNQCQAGNGTILKSEGGGTVAIQTKKVKGKTPIKAWFALKCSANRLKVFGSVCYTHIPAVKRSKLDEKAEKGYLVGYGTKSKGYMVYNLRSKKVTVLRDLIIDEYTYRDWDTKQVLKNNTASQKTNNAEASKAENSSSDIAEVDAHHDSPSMIPDHLLTFMRDAMWLYLSQLTMKKPQTMLFGIKTILNPYGSIYKRKERLAIKGYAQEAEIDFGDNLAPVARHDTLVRDWGFDQSESCIFCCDNQSAIAIAQNPVHHGRTKHIIVKFHVLHLFVKNKEIELTYCSTDDQIADMFTMALPRAKFELC
ncbi:hypothetical protein SLEP1_g17587 [Rubroshorea leprosula]|uniref:Retroviral polymerase SH3-like domain-containing protein n=1 Tax=Rubroshorea leprosula TaxID=152421 RepID=A0AAV5J3S9_9ROSI|nr:hypothetical protein SLEP1_g17587 [Rubroshorea leprosula]